MVRVLPEKLHVSSVRNLVVNVRRLDWLERMPVERIAAERMTGEIVLGVLLPFRIVTTRSRARPGISCFAIDDTVAAVAELLRRSAAAESLARLRRKIRQEFTVA